MVTTPDFIWKDRFHGTAQRWWILVEVMPLEKFLLDFCEMINHVNKLLDYREKYCLAMKHRYGVPYSNYKYEDSESS